MMCDEPYDDDEEDEGEFHDTGDGVIHIRLPGGGDSPIDRFLERFELATNVERTGFENLRETWPDLFNLANEVQDDLKRSDLDGEEDKEDDGPAA